MPSDDGNWCLIESDPAVFTEMIKGFGCEDLECEEVYDLDETSSVSDALAFIFLFNYDEKHEETGNIVKDANEKGIFFASQTIQNACATQALINTLLNIDAANVGQTLSDFKAFVSDFDSLMKGTALSNSDQIRIVHNSFSPCQLFEFDGKLPKSSDNYHFVSYLPINGVLYELDGLKPGPVDHGVVPTGSTWIDVVGPLLTKRMKKCVDGKFNILAVVPSRISMYERQLAQLKSESSDASTDCVSELRRSIENEKRKLAMYKIENVRRRHNYLPLVVEFLKILGENGRLVDLTEKAQTLSQGRGQGSKQIKLEK